MATATAVDTEPRVIVMRNGKLDRTLNAENTARVAAIADLNLDRVESIVITLKRDATTRRL
jgi:hypothetical protein